MTTTRRDLIERIVPGFGVSLADRRSNGQSWAQIRDWLRDDYTITVSTETLRRWASQ